MNFLLGLCLASYVFIIMRNLNRRDHLVHFVLYFVILNFLTVLPATMPGYKGEAYTMEKSFKLRTLTIDLKALLWSF